ncbi:MAG TPA: hypothetical protein VMF69_02865 [Gemmataceae bacterium]|nr:hypothetical protein [Gemmataceae bacterium]
MSVYVLQHVHALENGFEDVKFIGVYSSKENAREAIVRLSEMPGFSEIPDGFHVDEYEIDKDHWREGYLTFKDKKGDSRRKRVDEKERRYKRNSVKKK